MKTKKTKVCNTCNNRKKISYFYKYPKDRYDNRCKDCTSKIRRKHYKNNKEQIKIRCNKNYHNNINRARVRYKREWADPTKQKINKERSKIWRENNGEHKRKQDKIYYENNKEKYYEAGRRRRARKLKVKENFTIEEEKFILKLFNYRCFNCEDDDNLTIDHLKPLIKGHPLTITNAIVLCRSCNSSKGTKDPEIFFTIKQLDKIGKMLSI